jgi:general secretion pathway protein B
MSYILDAIRKSDQQRKHGAVPTLPTAPAAVEVTRHPAISLNGLLAAFLVGTGLVIGWLRPWQPEQTAFAPAAISARPLATSPRPAAPAPPEAVGKSGEEPPVRNSTGESAAPSAATTRHDAPPLVGQAQTAAFAEVPKEAATATPDKPVDTGLDANEGQGVGALEELPPQVQRDIPSMSISFHFYSSSAKDRRVMINETMLRQGDSIAPGLRLEQITPDGVVLGYKGYRFQRGVR